MNNIMNALVYCENGNLFIRKPNGLEYTFENVDAPVLGFDFDVVIYDDNKIKIKEWIMNKDFHEQEHIPLTEEECQMIESYIGNSEPPTGVTLQTQHVQRLHHVVHQQIDEMVRLYGFSSFVDVVACGREGSNNPKRSDARRVLEFYDNAFFIFSEMENEIMSTREDHLRDFNYYLSRFPDPVIAPGSRG